MATWRYNIFKTRTETSIPCDHVEYSYHTKNVASSHSLLWRVIERALYSDFIQFFVPLFAEVLWAIFPADFLLS